MLDLSEITARARAAPRQTTDVEVVFDAGITSELEALRTQRATLTGQLTDIDTDLETELRLLTDDTRAGDPRPQQAKDAATERRTSLETRLTDIDRQVEEVQARAAEFVVVFRFTALHRHEWDDLCARSAPRDGHPDDAGRDYNMDDVTRIAAARTGTRVIDDGTTVPVTAEEWAAVWETLHRLELRAIRLAVWTLNEFAGLAAHSEAVVAARKVSTARPAATPTSPSTSGSPPDDSTAGNPPPSPTTSTTTTDG